MEALVEALKAAIEEVLTEHGLLESKGKGGSKGKDKDKGGGKITLKALLAAAKEMEKADLKKALKKLKADTVKDIDEDDYEKAAELFGIGGEDDDGEITIELLAEKLTELVNKEGKPEAKKVLKKLKVEKLAEIDEDDFPKAMELIKAALGEDDDSGGGDAEDLFGSK